jgi:hypothetical protein
MNAPGTISQSLFHFFLSFLLGYVLFREKLNPVKNHFKVVDISTPAWHLFTIFFMEAEGETF